MNEFFLMQTVLTGFGPLLDLFVHVNFGVWLKQRLDRCGISILIFIYHQIIYCSKILFVEENRVLSVFLE